MKAKRDLVEDMRRVADLLNSSKLSRSEYLAHGKFSAYDIYDGGDTWDTLCAEAGVTTRKVELVSDETYFERLRYAVETLGRLPNVNERKRFGLNFNKRRFPTLSEFIETAIAKGIIDAKFGNPDDSLATVPSS